MALRLRNGYYILAPTFGASFGEDFLADEDNFSRIANRLDEISQRMIQANPLPHEHAIQLAEADAYIFDADGRQLIGVEKVNRVPLTLLRGVDDAKQQLVANTDQFARGLGANNALLWGAKGMGKSSLVKSVHAHVNANAADGARLVLVEINREDIVHLPLLLRALAEMDARFILFCDDLSFSAHEDSYKSLKSALDGGLEGRPKNVIFYATSNRRHLLPRDMIDNEQATAVSPGEAIDEKVSLSDRFGLWLGFHNCDQDTYFSIILGYAKHFGLAASADELKSDAVRWAQLRGARSGRVAMQYIAQKAGELGVSLD